MREEKTESKNPLSSVTISSPTDRWILNKYNETINAVTSALDHFAYSVAAQSLYSFFWHEFCDWYLEICKIRQKKNDTSFAPILGTVFKGCLLMLHPFMPFLTEELWHKFHYAPESIMHGDWPKSMTYDKTNIDKIEAMRELIVGIRNIRAEMRIDINKKVECLINIKDKELSDFLLEPMHQNLIFELAKVANIKLADKKPTQSSVFVIKDLEAYVPLAGLIDFDKERTRITTEIESIRQELGKINKLLADENFLSKAKSNVIERERERKINFEDKLTRLELANEALK
jgi:valyl-tRNA synthetase